MGVFQRTGGWLLVACLGASAPALAASGPGAGLTAASATAATAVGTAEAEPVVHQVVVPIRGHMRGQEESILLTGLATIVSTVIRAPGAPPVAEITTDFSAVTARREESGVVYHVESPMRQQRRLGQPQNQTQSIDVSFPYYREADPLSAATATAWIRVNGAGKPLRRIAIDKPDDDRPAGQE